MAFSLRFEENAERRQRLRLAQQSRKRRARDTDESPHHPQRGDHQFASVSAMAASANAFVPYERQPPRLPSSQPPAPTQPQPAHSACVLGRRSMEPEKYCGRVSFDISIDYGSALATAGTAWNGTRLWQ